MKKIIKILSSQWSVLFAIILGIALNNINELFVSNCYAVSKIAQWIIQLLLPVIVFCLVSSGLIAIGKSGTKVIIVSFVTVFVLNVVFFLIMYPVFLTPIFNVSRVVLDQSVGIAIYKSAFIINLPKLSPEIGLFLAIGIWFISLFYNKYNKYIEINCAKIANFLMQNVFGSLVPFFIFGFVVNMNFNFIVPVLKAYYHVVFVVSLIQYVFLFILMFWLDGVRVFSNIKHMLPAIIVGFTTMSSGMALPKVITGLEKIGFERKKSAPILSLISLPFTWGDIFIMPALILIAMKVFNVEMFSFAIYVKCAFVFAFLKYTCCNIAGGCAICMIPLMENILGFSEEMVCFVVSITIALDAFSTASNVSGQFFAPRFIDRILNKFFKNV